jgi:hypothetical protein
MASTLVSGPADVRGLDELAANAVTVHPIVVYAQGQALGARIRMIALGGARIFDGDWRAFAIAARFARCAVVAAERLGENSLIQRINSLRHERPHLRLILVVDAADAKLLRYLSADEVVWIQDLGRELSRVIAEEDRGEFLITLARLIRTTSGVPVPLRPALALACDLTPPAISIKDLLRSGAFNRRTLNRQWQKTLGRNSGLRLQDFLDWVLLIRAWVLWDSYRDWSFIANELNIDERRLKVMARRLTDQTIGTPTSHTDLTRRFMEILTLPFADSATGLNSSLDVLK